VNRIFESGATVLLFGLIATTCCLLAPTWGVTTLSLAGLVDYPSYVHSWRTWWLGDVTGVLVITPVLLKWRKLLKDQLRPWQLAEAVSSLSLLAATTAFVFFGPAPGTGGASAPSFLPLPCLVWIAFRFRPRGVALATVLLSAIAILGTCAGAGPFARDSASASESLLLLQTFTGLTTMMALTLSAAATGHGESEAALRKLSAEMQRLALTDELTGLHNRRGFLLLAEQGLRVARRSRARFLLLFVDLDGLKQVNDTLGHKAGDALIVDAARVLNGVFRESDVIARLGGDEFAVFAVVDNSDTSAALGQRLQSRIAEFNQGADRAVPLSMSFGIEELSSEAEVSLEALVSKADRAMYERKREDAERRRTGETKRPGQDAVVGALGSVRLGGEIQP
jgi:diguanylate cyclase (GGDEF)-like protein